jgi:hypothetical protein
MLEVGAPVPDVQVWAAIREEPTPLRDLLGAGWTPTHKGPEGDERDEFEPP